MELFNLLTNSIDFIIIALVLCAGFFQSKYLFNIKISAPVKTLIVSAIFTIAYGVGLWAAGMFTKALIPKYILSYAVATSLYELLLKKYFSQGNQDVE